MAILRLFRPGHPSANLFNDLNVSKLYWPAGHLTVNFGIVATR